jgi:hypothetical protein
MIELTKRMHDQEIMDWLEEECGEDAPGAFGEALPEHMYHTNQEKVDAVNEVLKELGSTLTILGCVGEDDDGYTWRVQMIVHEGAA